MTFNRTAGGILAARVWLYIQSRVVSDSGIVQLISSRSAVSLVTISGSSFNCASGVSWVIMYSQSSMRLYCLARIPSISHPVDGTVGEGFVDDQIFGGAEPEANAIEDGDFPCSLNGVLLEPKRAQ